MMDRKIVEPPVRPPATQFVPGSSWVPDRVVTLKWRCGYSDPDERKRPSVGSDPRVLRWSCPYNFLYLLWLAITSRTLLPCIVVFLFG